MAEYLPFWPKAGIGAYVINGGNSVNIYSRALPTNGFTEVVIQMEIDATFGGSGWPAYTTVAVAPQVSNDGVNWKTLSSTLSIANNATFPILIDSDHLPWFCRGIPDANVTPHSVFLSLKASNILLSLPCG